VFDSNGSVSPASWGEGLSQTLAKLSAADIAALVLRDTPTPEQDAYLCVSRSVRRGFPADGCSTTRAVALSEEIALYERSAVGNSVTGSYLDMTNEFCSLHDCPYIVGGVLVYRDGNHITTNFARKAAYRLAAAI